MLFSPHSHRSHTLLGRRATVFPGILRVRLRNILEDIEVGTISLEVVPVPKLEEGATDCGHRPQMHAHLGTLAKGPTLERSRPTEDLHLSMCNDM